MKKTLLLAFSLILVLTLAFGLSSCKKDKGDAVTYTLDSSDFVGVAEYEGTLDTTGLYLVPSEGERIAVTADMLGGVDTLSTGEKEITFSYNEQNFTVNYVVKFSVTYIINGVETKQLVLDSNEVVVPNVPDVEGQQFEGWSRALPAHLTSNIVIEAIYQTLTSSQGEIFTWLGNGVIDLTGYAPAGADFEVLVLDEFEEEDSSLADVTIDSANAKISYSLNGNDPVIISFKAYEGNDLVAEKSWYIEKVSKPELTIGDKSGIVGITVGDRNAMQRVNNNSDITFKYQMTYSNGNVEINEGGDMLYISPVKAGVTNVTIKAINAMNALETIDLEYCVVVKPSVFTITELANVFGIENIWTVGGINPETLPALNLSYADAGEGFFENITWVTNNADVSVNNGVISFATTSKAAELVDVVARFSYNGITLDSQPMTIRCVYGGINVFNYNDLYTESVKTVGIRPIVLQASIKEDFSSSNYTEMHTTYEDGYYVNANILDKAKLKVLLQFRSDVYGNGYEINAHNATIGTHGEAIGVLTEASIFRGPLNLIAYADSNLSISAKAQDNICFAAYEGVTLNNLILKSCDLTPNSDGKIELNDLNYSGTTVEVLGDNVTIEYCRITNGRNLVRAFGDVNDETKVINVTIKNSILSYAREYILRVGSNRFVDCEFHTEEEFQAYSEANPWDVSPASPLLPGDSVDAKDYLIAKEIGKYDKLSAEQQAEYDAKYIMTYVTVENTVFEEAGIFAIALESHFAGTYLQCGNIFGEEIGGFEHWHDLAKTSYGAKLTFEGDVRLYNWKLLKDIDSSVLVDNGFFGLADKNPAGLTNKGFDVTKFEFNMKDLILTVYGKPGYKNIIDEIDGEQYVHNGLVIYGGGKNYSIFENNVSSEEFNHAFQCYPVSFAEVGQALLEVAAGSETFSFFIYDKTGTFKYNDQKNLENKYGCVYN